MDSTDEELKQMDEEYLSLEELQNLSKKLLEDLRVARDRLNWKQIWNVLAFPHLPITNNLAERTLRHWVIHNPSETEIFPVGVSGLGGVVAR